MERLNLFKSNDVYTVLKFMDKDQWRLARFHYIGGSDASTLVGLNPWKTNNELWKEKKGIVTAKDISDNQKVIYGVKAEDLLRRLFELDFENVYEVQYLEDVTLVSNSVPWRAYSPDGLLVEKESGRKGILEIKTTTIESRTQREKWEYGIPDNYFCQVLHGLLVTGFDFVILKAQLKSFDKDGDLKLETRHYRLEKVQAQEFLDWLDDKERDQYEKYYLGGEEPPTILNI